MLFRQSSCTSANDAPDTFLGGKQEAKEIEELRLAQGKGDLSARCEALSQAAIALINKVKKIIAEQLPKNAPNDKSRLNLIFDLINKELARENGLTFNGQSYSKGVHANFQGSFAKIRQECMTLIMNYFQHNPDDNETKVLNLQKWKNLDLFKLWISNANEKNNPILNPFQLGRSKAVEDIDKMILQLKNSEQEKNCNNAWQSISM